MPILNPDQSTHAAPPDPAVVALTVYAGAQGYRFWVRRGTNLRRVLLALSLSPYAPLTRQRNCGGRGLCATCGVWLEQGEPPPTHWHDALAAQYGYPRLSCQITLEADLTVRLLTDKLIWGQRDPLRRSRAWAAESPSDSVD
ncbi:MAG: 2Fe-2S iron-sulfur cluster binding domain-containing protein [Chloroflexaceae bacterium]|nr:2Fe-2S iron-sulfur cluster binding domain-containing protein [Chloroflexaceae bacterium]